MPNGETSLISRLLLLGFVGAVIGIGKLLASTEEITLRLILGRAILGSAASWLAGLAVIHTPGLGELELVAIAAALGIMGSSAIELAIKILMKRYLGAQRRDDKS
ncbi:phage P2 holin-like protein [Yersinia rohdei]|uniref:holin n=1 Tax=Yersinia rohdei TaxID=29485 RepID=UPI0005DE159F|nr:holin [Yersinia rohdei]CNI55564.1 phage P2 holin-like protein [Yersinia rohdei]